MGEVLLRRCSPGGAEVTQGRAQSSYSREVEQGEELRGRTSFIRTRVAPGPGHINKWGASLAQARALGNSQPVGAPWCMC